MKKKEIEFKWKEVKVKGKKFRRAAFQATKYPGVLFTATRSPDGKDGKDDEKVLTYYIQYRLAGKSFFEKAMKGEGDARTPAKTEVEARYDRDQKILGKVLPNSERREKEESSKSAKSSRWTFDKLWEAWKENNSNKSGLRRDDWRYGKHLKKTFGDIEPSALKPLDVDRLRKKLFEDDYAPDSVVSTISLLKRIANYGLDKQLCDGLTFRIKLNDKKLKRRNRTECLTPEQTEQYRKVCREYKNPQIGSLCRFVEQTGVRKENARDLKWSDIDFENGFVHLDKTKTDAKILPLSDVAIEILRNHPRTEGSEFVFAGRDDHNKRCAPGCGEHVPGRLADREIREGVEEIRDLADLPLFDGKKFRPLHGLRHALGSRLVNDGTSLFVVQHALGHATPSVTARYSHLTDSTLRDALNASNKPKTETA